jgi:hypothetical protein
VRIHAQQQKNIAKIRADLKSARLNGQIGISSNNSVK